MTPRRLLFLLLSLTLSAALPASYAAADETALGEDAPKPKKKKAKKKKGFDYEASKYKSIDLVDGQKSQYRFNDKGDPIQENMKKPVKKKKRSEPPEIGSGEVSQACGAEENCTERKTEADAL